MQSYNVFENGIGYLGKCLNLYLGNCGYLILFLCGIIYLLIRGNDEEREIFIPGTCILVLTVYNPIAPIILDKFFDVSSEYYRLFWIAPVIVLVPFVFSKLICQAVDMKEKIFIIAFSLVVIAVSGNFVYEKGIPFAENVFKVPDELIEITDIIHADSDEEYPKAFFEYEYNMEVRQYDPKILLTIDREDYIYAMNYSYSEEDIYNDEKPTNRMLAALIRNQDVDYEWFRKAVIDTKTQYIVLTKGNYKSQMLCDIGFELVDDTATHNIYRYRFEEPVNYELIDYTDIEHKFSYRRLK